MTFERPFVLPGIFLVLVVSGLYLAMENLSLYGIARGHAMEYQTLQAAVREKRKDMARLTAQARSNQEGLETLAGKTFPLVHLPDFIRELDQKMALRSLFREDVAYARKETSGTFTLVRVQMTLTGSYEEFRRFLADLESRPGILWVKSVQAGMDKTFLRFSLVLQILVKT